MADLKWKITSIEGDCASDVAIYTAETKTEDDKIEIGREYESSVSSLYVDVSAVSDECKNKDIKVNFSASTKNTKTFLVHRNCDEPEPGDCEIPDKNTDLNDYLSVFNASVGRNITPGDTPCAYTYLKEGYNYVKDNNATTIAWFLANMLSELTPDPHKVTNYFKDATKGTETKDFGKIPTLTSTIDATIDYETKIYEDRINSAYLFAKFRNENYTADKELVQKARADLGGTLNGTGLDTIKELRDDPTRVSEYPDYVPTAYGNYIPAAPSRTDVSNCGNEPNNTYDGKLMYGLNDCQGNGYCNTDDLSAKYVYHLLPVYDKRHGNCYGRTIFNVSKEGVSDSTIENFINKCEEVEYLTSNFAKSGISRCRPAKCKVGGRDIDYICNDTIENSYAQTVCGSESRSTCNEGQKQYYTGTTSYPSGHASWGYTVALFSTLISGEHNCNVNDPDAGETITMSVKERGILYGQHRYIVKAHWPSDVLIGQVIASSCIGYLMGFSEFITLYENIINGDTPGPIPTKGNFTYTIAGYGQCNCEGENDKIELYCPLPEGSCKDDCQTEDHPIGRTPEVGVSDNVHFKIEVDGGGVSMYNCALVGTNCSLGSEIGTEGDLLASNRYLLKCDPLPEGSEKIAKITFSNSSGIRIVYYKLCCNS